ncbi:alkane 1-monooxygenase [Muriicola sp. Z0-33]|uniref:alkane 1-monooxygenase n=1 Tax=Muriicola sp. Z0-33 TaxID=2816957 RepID=UPI00223790C2|nr:alkane 1-monooxygenase [Muriicola sp. Z0-33]MCW5514674.1 alkane 1-monooxygenase [Muriicola sp. Z0-33]
MRDLKYLAAITIPISAIIGLYFKGSMTFFTPFYAFVIIPILELIMPLDNSNLNQNLAAKKKNNKLFDYMLYLNVPLVYALLIYSLWDISSYNYSNFELGGLIFSLGVVLGTNGINVAHELGHRSSFAERLLGKFLLLPSFYMHFYIEHNFGHHLHAATKEDPATAKYNQSVYSFWITSVFRQYISAWKLQTKLLRSENRGFLSYKNDMLWFTLLQLTYVFTLFYFFGSTAVYFALSAGVVGFLLLETVNYIEHYGLIRNKLASGRYERVQEIHSWNSNHVIGRIVLYELTQHSDHHYKSTKKYQTLDCHDTSPQMPFGYPTSMVLSLVPPLWFKIMNPRIPAEMKPTA